MSKPLTGKIFNLDQVTGLPEPVKRYFKYAIKPGQPYISYARITHDGQFKTGIDKDWITIKGEEYFTTEKPGFIWKGASKMFTALDMFIADKGKFKVSLYAGFIIENHKGPLYDKAELIRWLGENVLFPTNLLPGKGMIWTTFDENTAKLSFEYNGISMYFLVSFNDIGEIIQLETLRSMDEKAMEPWVIKLADYKLRNSIMVPHTFNVTWRIEMKEFTYAKFLLKNIDYDIPERFPPFSFDSVSSQ